MLSCVHDLVGLLDRDQLNHYFRCAALFDSQKREKVVVVDLMDQSVDLNIVVQVLTATTARQVHELLDVFLALRAQIVVDSLNVDFFQEALGSILQFTDLHGQLLDLNRAACVACLGD